jgi:hypothetical protein
MLADGALDERLDLGRRHPASSTGKSRENACACWSIRREGTARRAGSWVPIARREGLLIGADINLASFGYTYGEN